MDAMSNSGLILLGDERQIDNVAGGQFISSV
jgi:hypothetical protein